MPRSAAFCSAITMACLGDITAQHFERGGHSDGEQGHDFDKRRTLAACTYSACMAAGFWVPWHQMLSRRFGEGSVRSLLQKLVINQGIATPLISLPTYFSFTSLLRGHDVA